MKTILDWPRPTTKKQVKSFLGLVGYYQRFIPGFPTLESPLHDLTQRAPPDRGTWSEAAEGPSVSLDEPSAPNPSY